MLINLFLHFYNCYNKQYVLRIVYSKTLFTLGFRNLFIRKIPESGIFQFSNDSGILKAILPIYGYCVVRCCDCHFL